MGKSGPSPVTAKVITMAASSRADLAELAAVVGTDPVLSARLIQAANSAAYSNRKLISSVQDAVRKIGCSAVGNLAVAVGAIDLVPRTDSFDPIRFWQHSLATARLCEGLAATAIEPKDAAPAYLAGLCHDLGAILFQSFSARNISR